MFTGSQDEVAQVQLRDKQGRVRAKLYVDKDGNAKFDFLNEKGEVTKSYPEH